MKGLFVVFEGMDKSGKTTTIDNVIDELGADNVVYSKGLNSPTIAGKIASRFTSTLGYLLELAYQTYFIIKPGLRKGKIVLQDRYEYSITSYVPGVDKWYNKLLIKMFRPFLLKPDVLFYLTVDDDERLRRIAESGELSKHSSYITMPKLTAARENRFRELLHGCSHTEIDTTRNSIENTCRIALDEIKNGKSAIFLNARETQYNYLRVNIYETRSP